MGSSDGGLCPGRVSPPSARQSRPSRGIKRAHLRADIARRDDVRAAFDRGLDGGGVVRVGDKRDDKMLERWCGHDVQAERRAAREGHVSMPAEHKDTGRPQTRSVPFDGIVITLC